MSWQILQGDARAVLSTLPAGSVHCAVTSPPYYALRDYGVEGQIGLEATPEEFIAALVAVFREVRRVLRDDGTLWLNLGDSYSTSPTGLLGRSFSAERESQKIAKAVKHNRRSAAGTKPKDLIGIPWAVAFALRADGWWLRSEIIWSKPNPMPESVTDRPTKSHEQLFLLAKAPTYYYDAEAIRERSVSDHGSGNGFKRPARLSYQDANGARGNDTPWEVTAQRNRRSVWTIPTEAYPDAHFATFPTALVKPCILAGTSEEGVCSACGAPRRRVVERKQYGDWNPSPDRATSRLTKGALKTGGFVDGYEPPKNVGWEPSCACNAPACQATILDPFSGSGTTGSVAVALGRSFVGIDLSEEYCQLARRRIGDTNPSLFSFAE